MYILVDMKQHSGMFEKGKPRDCQIRRGEIRNPNGRSRVDFEMRALARSYGPQAIEALVSIALDAGARHADRIYACNSLLDRGYGKPIQEIAADIALRPQIVILPPTLSAAEFEERYSSSSLLDGGAEK
jgi:hypothetical protein